jgi:hypothetical protein
LISALGGDQLAYTEGYRRGAQFLVDPKEPPVDYASTIRPGRVLHVGPPEVSVGSNMTVEANLGYGFPQPHEWQLPVSFLWWAISSDDEYEQWDTACVTDSLPESKQLIWLSIAAVHPNVTGAEADVSTIEGVLQQAYFPPGIPIERA